MTEPANLIRKYAEEFHAIRVAARKAIHIQPKPSRRAFLLSGAADPILAMASQPFEPGTVGKLNAAT